MLRIISWKKTGKSVATYYQIGYITEQLHTKSILSSFSWLVKPP